MRHLLGIESLKKDTLTVILENADKFVELSERTIKKAPALRGKTIINLFLEPSTRTRASFEIAGKRLSADTINITGSSSSTTKGETLLDTGRTLQSMNPDVLVVRHRASGAAHFLAQYLSKTSVVNAGDGMHEHPTQALLDLLTLKQRLEGVQKELSGLTIAIVGDVLHSRVARSNILAHQLLGNKIRLVGPPTLVPDEFRSANCFGSEVEISHDLSQGIEGADVVYVLRLQHERQTENFIPSVDEYSREFCVTESILSASAPDCVVMHPGPANRGVEISSVVHDGDRSLIAQQVKNGVAVRMAVLFQLITRGEEARVE